MSYGRSIGEQSLNPADGGLVRVFQSNVEPGRLYLGTQGEDGDFAVYLTPVEAYDLARKIMTEAGYAVHAWVRETVVAATS